MLGKTWQSKGTDRKIRETRTPQDSNRTVSASHCRRGALCTAGSATSSGAPPWRFQNGARGGSVSKSTPHASPAKNRPVEAVDDGQASLKLCATRALDEGHRRRCGCATSKGHGAMSIKVSPCSANRLFSHSNRLADFLSFKPIGRRNDVAGGKLNPLACCCEGISSLSLRDPPYWVCSKHVRSVSMKQPWAEAREHVTQGQPISDAVQAYILMDDLSSPHHRSPCCKLVLLLEKAGWHWGAGKDTAAGCVAPLKGMHAKSDCSARWACNCRSWAACRGQLVASEHSNGPGQVHDAACCSDAPPCPHHTSIRTFLSNLYHVLPAKATFLSPKCPNADSKAPEEPK